ncbi:lipopolysaccharide biosynthesis protein [Pseudohongiella sp.]|uniref:Polysaccharide biosynthesis protein C-terminal domain-containing protein n=1 Tax=marine sediment metagenome TaxID=412755 RepID=A0A0F9YHZ0_9ZZZZ|nr:oligosaccharide flippase family protein [Pseudohongiella sp.]
MKIPTPVGLSQRDRLSFLLRDSVLYGGAAAISKAFALITFPMLARHFSVADYGVLDYFMVLSSFLAILFIFGQDSAVARYFYEYEDRVVRCQLISQSLAFQLAGLSLLLPLLWWGAEWFANLLVEAPESVRLFKIVLMQLPFLMLINFSQNLLKWTFARAQFLTMSLGFTLVQTSLLVVAVLLMDVGIQGVLVVTLCTSIVFGALGLFFVRRWLARPRDFKRIYEMLPYAMPFGVICVLAGLSPTLERTIIDQLLGAEELGLYAAGTKIAMLVGLAVTAFQTAWGPFSLSLYKQEDAGETYNLVLKFFVLGMCVIVCVLTLMAQPLIKLLATDRYIGAVVLVFPLVMGLAIQATSWITEIGVSIAKRSYLNLYAYFLAVIATLASIMLLAPHFGLLGVGLGVMIGHIVKAIVASWLAQRVYPLPWHYSPVVKILGLTLLFGLLAKWLEHHWGAVAYNIAMITGMIAVLCMGWSVLFNPEERRGLIAFLRLRLVRSIL